MTNAMHGGLALLSALPERFTAAVKSGGLLLRWMPSHCVASLSSKERYRNHSCQRLSVLLPERFDNRDGLTAPSAAPCSLKLRALSPDPRILAVAQWGAPLQFMIYGVFDR